MLLNGICVRRARRARTRSSGLKLLDRAFCLWSLLRLARTKGCPPVSIRFRFARAFLTLSVSLSFSLAFSLITPLFVAAALFFEFRKLQEHCFASAPPGRRDYLFSHSARVTSQASETVRQPGTIRKSASFCSSALAASATRDSPMRSAESREFRC